MTDEPSGGGHTPGLGTWQWRPAPEDGGRDFGNANAFATPPTLETLVRETGQNSLDASAGGPIVIRYRLIELSKGNAAFESFERAARLDELRTHVGAAAKHAQKFGARLRHGLTWMEGSDHLSLLRIDDYGTTGLYGDEYPVEGKQNPFAALIRNNLDTAKSASTAGGSFGLGKAVNWTCSAIMSVLVASEIDPRHLDGLQSSGYRVIGKSELTWHQVGTEAFAGPGWFASGVAGYQSIWSDEATLERLQLDRHELPDVLPNGSRYGTSLLIIGFRDPSPRGESNGSAAIEEISRAAALNFWPAVLRNQLHVLVEHVVDGEVTSSSWVHPRKYVPSFCEAFEAYETDEVLEVVSRPTEVAVVKVPLTIMPTLHDQREVDPISSEMNSDTHLVVRLADPSAQMPDKQLQDHVALVRGRLMVVKYLQQRNVLVGGRSFHGILLAGTAAKDALHARYAEQFLRASEPPAHDEWTYVPELAAMYHRGTGARINEFFRQLTETLRGLIRREHGDDLQGPIELRKLLETSSKGSPGSSRHPSYSSLSATVVNGAWKIQGEISVRGARMPLRLRPRLWLEVESGKRLRLDWAEVRLSHASTNGVALDGHGFLVDGPTKSLKFEGTSMIQADGIPATASRLRIDLDWEQQ